MHEQYALEHPFGQLLAKKGFVYVSVALQFGPHYKFQNGEFEVVLSVNDETYKPEYAFYGPNDLYDFGSSIAALKRILKAHLLTK